MEYQRERYEALIQRCSLLGREGERKRKGIATESGDACGLSDTQVVVVRYLDEEARNAIPP